MNIVINRELRTDEQGAYYYTEYDRHFSDGSPYSMTERISHIVISVESARNAKYAEINKSADNELSQGFNSSALGTEYHYRNDDKFPQWYRDQMIIQNSASPDSTISWMTEVNGTIEMKDHTAEEFLQVFKDLKALEQSVEYKRLSLLEQARGCDTVEGLDNITW